MSGYDILIREGTDLDGTFRAYMCDWNEMASFNGWMWAFEPVAADLLEG